MTGTATGGNFTAEDLRRAFDASFAAPSGQGRQETDSFIALSIGGDGYAIRIGEIEGLATARKIVPIASPIVELLGIAGGRGILVPVYSLAALLGYAQDRAPPRWFLQCRGAFPVALAFADLDGYVELARADLGSTGPCADPRYVRDVRGDTSRVRSVIDIPSLVDAIGTKVAAAGIVKEP